MSETETITLAVSASTGEPIYKQLMDQVRRMIASQQLAPGQAMPSVRQLALQLEVNPMTISKAYSFLEAEGLLVRQRGKGMFVAKETMNTVEPEDRLSLLKPTIEKLKREAKDLDIDLETIIDLLKKD